MTIYKVADLIGWRLDAAVAAAEGEVITQAQVNAAGCNDLLHYWLGRENEIRHPGPPGLYRHPSGDWRAGGPIIEREGIWLQPDAYVNGKPTRWLAGIYSPIPGPAGDFPIPSGSTPLEAAMRAYVDSKFGETVELPD